MNILPVMKWLWKFLWTETGKIRLLILASFLFTTVSIVLNILVPIGFKKCVDLVFNNENVTAIYVILVFCSYALCWTVSQISQILRTMFFLKPIENSISEFLACMFANVINLPMNYHFNRKSGSILAIIERAEAAIPRVINAMLWQFVPVSLEVMLAFLVVLKLYGHRYAIILLVTIILYLIFTIYTAKNSLAAQARKSAESQKASSYFLDCLLNIETIKAYNNEPFEKYELDKKLAARAEVSASVDTRMLILNIAQMLIVGLGLMAVNIYAATDIYHQKLTVGDFVLLNNYILQFSIPMSYFGYVILGVRQAFADLLNAMDLANIKSDIDDAKRASVLSPVSSSIIFDNVSFGYEANKMIIKNISFTIPEGKTTAFVGATAAGKSTLAKLLLGFFEPDSGRILIGNQDIACVTQASLRQSIGLVSQDTILFNRSLYQNILYGNPSASSDEVEQVINKVHLDSLIRHLPYGYHTEVGERGLKISGGERQRIGIARALLKTPKIYLFDEATSALDSYTEKSIQANIEDVVKGNTTLIITHRLATVVNADYIYVLENGQIVASGTHCSLLTANDLYAKLWHLQCGN